MEKKKRESIEKEIADVVYKFQDFFKGFQV
jgi:hypothetical protein